jgi:hypothetical protein
VWALRLVHVLGVAANLASLERLARAYLVDNALLDLVRADLVLVHAARTHANNSPPAPTGRTLATLAVP